MQLASGITLVPALFLVALRIYARLGLARKLGVDDCTFELGARSLCVYTLRVIDANLARPGKISAYSPRFVTFLLVGRVISSRPSY